MCQHQPRCTDSLAPDRMAARVVASQPTQGWCLLCNGVVLFDDGGNCSLTAVRSPLPVFPRPALRPRLPEQGEMALARGG